MYYPSICLEGLEKITKTEDMMAYSSRECNQTPLNTNLEILIFGKTAFAGVNATGVWVSVVSDPWPQQIGIPLNQRFLRALYETEPRRTHSKWARIGLIEPLTIPRYLYIPGNHSVVFRTRSSVPLFELDTSPGYIFLH
jgi:hypothetical protein